MRVANHVKTRIARAALAAMLTCAPTPAATAAPAPATVAARAASAPSPPVIVPPALDRASAKTVSLRVDLASQRLQLLVGETVALDSPVTTGRKNFETPTGEFTIASKLLTHPGRDYGDLVDADGRVVVPGVYRHRDPVPPRLRFRPLERRHVLRVYDETWSLHAGRVGSLPVSDGAVILPPDIARLVFAKVAAGCRLTVRDRADP